MYNQAKHHTDVDDDGKLTLTALTWNIVPSRDANAEKYLNKRLFSMITANEPSYTILIETVCCLNIK